MGGRVRTGRASARLGLHHAALSFEKDQNTELSKYLLKRTALAALGLREGLSKQGRGAGRGTPRPWSPPPTRCRGGSEEEFSSVETRPGRTAMWERAAGPGGGAAHLPHPSCTRTSGWPRTAAPGTPCRTRGNVTGRLALRALGPPEGGGLSYGLMARGVSHWPPDVEHKEDTEQQDEQRQPPPGQAAGHCRLCWVRNEESPRGL